MLVKEFGGGVDVVVGSRIRSSDDHDGQPARGWIGRMVDAVVVDGRLQEMRVIFEPGIGSVSRRTGFCSLDVPFRQVQRSAGHSDAEQIQLDKDLDLGL